MTLTKINWGILGCGNIAQKFVGDLALIDNAVLFSVASRSLERAKIFASKNKAVNAYGNYDQLFLDPNIDIVYIATPHTFHAELSIKAMNHNKHVLCEKPIAINRKETERIIETAQRTKRFFMEALWTRFNPSLVAIKKYIESGALGKITNIDADFSFLSTKPLESRVLDLKLGGGAILDIGIYPVFLAYLFLGIPNKIIANSTFHKVTKCDIETTMVLYYDGNTQAELYCSFTSNGTNEALIKGTKGCIYIENPWHAARQYRLVKDEHIETFKLPLVGIGFGYEIIECHNCISANVIESKKWTHQNSFELISILDTIRKQVGLKYPQEITE